jgi:hypothetical protein
MEKPGLKAVVLVKVIGIFDSVFILLVLCINACVLSAMWVPYRGD